MRLFLITLVLVLVPLTAVAQKIPVVLDTDIGDDIDDTWALAMLLRSERLDLKLVTTEYGKAEYRAKVICKLLTAAGRTDVPVGLGAGGRNGTGNQQPWVQEYKLSDYAGKVHEDGVQALIDVVMHSATPITIIGIGPTPTLHEALKREPRIAARARFSGMQGSVRVGYGGKKQVDAEWNVKCDIPASKAVFAAPWLEARITPLDTCGTVTVGGERFARLKQSNDKLAQTVLENYRIWAKKKSLSELNASSTLFDTVAVCLADPANDRFYQLERLPITVDDKGVTRIDAAGRQMEVATRWKDKNAYLDYLVDRIMGK